MNIEATADLIMSAIQSDAFDREACVKILRDDLSGGVETPGRTSRGDDKDEKWDQERPNGDSVDHSVKSAETAPPAQTSQPKSESWQEIAREAHEKIVNLILPWISQHIVASVTRPMYNIILAAIERSHAAQPQPPPWACSKWGNHEHDWLACPDCLKAYDIQNEAQPSDQPPSFAKATDDKQEWGVERSKDGVSNPMARIMRGDQVIFGWTMRPFSESLQKICDAHNAALADDDKKRFFAFWRENGQLKQELDAVNNELTRWRGLYQERDNQLAAERETKDNYKREAMELARLLDTERQRREQAEREHDDIASVLQTSNRTIKQLAAKVHAS